MKYYLKLFLLSVAIGGINILAFLILLQFQIVHNSGYVAQELVTLVLIVVGIPIQFLILIIIAFLFKRKKEALLMISVVVVITCFLLLWFTSKEERGTFSKEKVYNRSEKYDYQQGISTPEGYPIKLLSESMFDVAVKGDQNPVTLLETGKVYSVKWGLGDTTFKSSDDGGVLVPDSLKLYWYSYLENKYYGLNSKINKTKISAYFKKGFLWDINGSLTNAGSIKKTYDGLFAGIAPGGDVVLFISGGNETREIEVFKAKEMNVSKFQDYDKISGEAKLKVLSDTCTCENDAQSRRIVNNGQPIPLGIWTKKFRQKFNWKLSLNTFGQTKSEIDFYFYNGERYALYNEDVLKLDYKKQVLPEFIKITFIKNAKKYKAFLEFNENELFQNFEKLTKINRNEPVTMFVNINNKMDKATVQLSCKNEEINLEKIKKISIYD